MTDKIQEPGFDEQHDAEGRPDGRRVLPLSEIPAAALNAVFGNQPDDTPATRTPGRLAEVIPIEDLADARATRLAARTATAATARVTADSTEGRRGFGRRFI